MSIDLAAGAVATREGAHPPGGFGGSPWGAPPAAALPGPGGDVGLHCIDEPQCGPPAPGPGAPLTQQGADDEGIAECPPGFTCNSALRKCCTDAETYYDWLNETWDWFWNRGCGTSETQPPGFAETYGEYYDSYGPPPEQVAAAGSGGGGGGAGGGSGGTRGSGSSSGGSGSGTPVDNEGPCALAPPRVDWSEINVNDCNRSPGSRTLFQQPATGCCWECGTGPGGLGACNCRLVSWTHCDLWGPLFIDGRLA